MKERVLNYLAHIDSILEENGSETDYDTLAKEHLVQISFFMHERLVHLIVTVLFAIGTLMSVFTFLALENIVLLGLIALLIGLLIPYVMHYYLLENSVQKMYEQYDKMVLRK